MTSQGRREEHSPVKSPHFFKIILPDSLRDGKLRIPTRFIRRYGESLSNLALIKLPNGAEWKLELAKCDGEVWLKKGWREFVEYSSLKLGHFLVFRYEGKSHFCVLVFDESATEIDYPFNSSPGEDLKIHEKLPVSRMEEMESDSSVEILDDFPAYPKAREKSPLSCPRPHKMMRTNSSAQIGSTANLSRLVPHSTKNKSKEANLKKSKGQAKFHSTMLEFEGVEGTNKKSPKSEVLRRIPNVTADEKAKDLQKARGVKPENPHFDVVMQASYVRFGCMSIPSCFAKRHLNKKLDDIILWLSDGRRWSVRYKFNRRAACQFGGGWKEFVQDNNLDVGDVCSFELIKGIKISFQVVIFRATEEHFPKLPKMESDSSVKILDDFPAYPKAREKSPLSCPRPHKMMRTHSSAQIGSTANLSRLVPHSTKNKSKEANLKKSKGQAKFHSTTQEFEGVEGTTKQSPKSEVLRRIPKMTADEKAKDLQKARGIKPENPHFDVVMQASYVRFGRVSIPSGFAKRHLNKKLDDIILWLSDGRRWSVRYKFNRRAACQFGGGWKEFVQDNNLDVGDVCSFELIKGIKISFQVVIFRATEEHCPKLPKSESDSSVKILDDFPAYPKMREKSLLSCPRPHKMMRMNPSAKTGNTLSRLVPHCTQNQCKEAKLDKFKGQSNLHSTKQDFEGVEGVSATSRCPESEVPRRTQTVNEKSSALQKASGFKPENPYFLVVMQPSYLRCALKSAVLRSFLNIKSGQRVMLQVGEKSWPVKFNSYPHLSYAVLSAGWRTFVKANSLQVGDVCVFELIKSDDVMLKVSIFRCPSNPFGGLY